MLSGEILSITPDLIRWTPAIAPDDRTIFLNGNDAKPTSGWSPLTRGSSSAVEIEERTEGDVTALFLRGKMAGGEDEELLREEVENLIEVRKLNIVLDMASVPDIDSACLGEIRHCQIRGTPKDGKLRLANLSEKLRILLARTRIAWVHEDLLLDPP